MYESFRYGFESNELNNPVARSSGAHETEGSSRFIKIIRNREEEVLRNLKFILGLSKDEGEM